MAEKIDLDKRVVIVSGAGSGLGRAHARMLASQGAQVLVTDINETACKDTVRLIESAGGVATSLIGDVADRRLALDLAECALDTFGRIDGLVNNAGILRDKTFHKQTLESFEEVIRVHLLGSAFLTHACWAHMRRSGYGRVVFTSSSSGLWGNFGQTNYAAAKLGIIGLMKSLSLESARNGITVNAIAPFAATPMSHGFFGEKLRGALNPDYVAALVTYLCSEACTLNGMTLEVGLGRVAWVHMVRSQGRVVNAPASPEAVSKILPAVLSEPANQNFEDLFQDLEAFACHCSHRSPESFKPDPS